MSKGWMEMRRVSLVTRWAKKVPAQGRVRVKALSWGVSDLVEKNFSKSSGPFVLLYVNQT